MKRSQRIESVNRKCSENRGNAPVSSYYGEDTFNFKVMSERLPGDIYSKFRGILHEGKVLDIDTANAIAHAMKEWAIAKGATHFAHWFQPMTGSTAEKHDSFVEPGPDGLVIERFSGKQLVQGEPDASSFPSGGIRSTFEARGYTAWDMSSPAFVRKNGIATTLCIPTVFISYTGEALDKKTPLLRSDKAISKSAVRMLKLLGSRDITKVYSTLGPEQEYFLIDKDYYYKREDLVLTGRSIIGAPPAKGQQLEDQYFGTIKERVQSYMHDVEIELYRLGIPAKTRHNEVAPSQFEIAPVFEESNLAVDHNQLLMDTMRNVAKRHNFVVLFHEKPFAGINGSGKHLNWSLSDNLGNNLLKPGDTPHENIQFLMFLAATLRAVYRHADLLRASVASSANDHRLGANEAPPAIISVFLGEQLTHILENIENGRVTDVTDEAIIDLGLSSLPVLSKDNTDRNRTSPFAFTGNKFEFRAVGASQSISFPATVINTIVAESLDELADKIEKKGGDVNQAAIEIIRETIKESKAVTFMGDNYSGAWEAEAERRGLPNYKTTPAALKAFEKDKTKNLFEKYGVLSRVELESRYRIRVEKYIKELDIEAKTMYDMVMTGIYPAAVNYQKALASSIHEVVSVIEEDTFIASQKQYLREFSNITSRMKSLVQDLASDLKKAGAIHDEDEKAEFFCERIKEGMNNIRECVDSAEMLIDDNLWPIPKYWEMLFVN